MENMILIDLETGGLEVESGIYEVALIVIEDGQPVEKLQLGNIMDESLIERGYGAGYYECSDDTLLKEKFNEVLSKYQYPLVAHRGSFDRKFLVYYDWIDEDYPFYDSIRAIKLVNPKLFSYSMSHLMEYLEYDKEQPHTAIGDVEILYDILNYFKPTIWLPIGEQARKKRNGSSQSIDFTKYNFEKVKDIFHGKTMVFTGKGFYERKYLAQLAVKCGAIVDKGVTKRTEILVVGEDSGQKLKKATDLGCEIMDMSDFYELVYGIELEDVYKAPITIKPKADTENIENKVIEDNFITGKRVALSCMKASIKEKLAKVITNLGGTPSMELRVKKTDLWIYQANGEEHERMEKAIANEIEHMTLGKFNKLIEQYL